MVENTLQKIKTIEAQAEQIIKQAQQESFINLRKAGEHHEQDLVKLKAELKKQGEDLAQAAQAAAAEEVEQIKAQTARDIAELKKSVEPRANQAKKEILKCLS